MSQRPDEPRRRRGTVLTEGLAPGSRLLGTVAVTICLLPAGVPSSVGTVGTQSCGPSGHPVLTDVLAFVNTTGTQNVFPVYALTKGRRPLAVQIKGSRAFPRSPAASPNDSHAWGRCPFALRGHLEDVPVMNQSVCVAVTLGPRVSEAMSVQGSAECPLPLRVSEGPAPRPR